MWVRTASARDLPAISQLLGTVWHQTYDGIYGAERVSEITASWHAVSALERQLKAPSSEFLVADDGKTISGMAYARQDAASVCKIHQLYVLEKFQGKGVGKLLLDEIEESFFDVREFSLEVDEKNDAAIGFYEYCGFKLTGKTENCGEADSRIPALMYSKIRG